MTMSGAGTGARWRRGPSSPGSLSASLNTWRAMIYGVARSTQPSNRAPDRAGAAVGSSVRGDVIGHQREEPVVPALAAEHRRPESIGFEGEHVLGPGRLDDPGGLLQLGLQ